MVDTKKLIKRLKNQIAVANSLGSEFVYITKNDAKKCLELAEAEDVILESFNETKNTSAVMETNTINERKD